MHSTLWLKIHCCTVTWTNERKCTSAVYLSQAFGYNDTSLVHVLIRDFTFVTWSCYLLLFSVQKIWKVFRRWCRSVWRSCYVSSRPSSASTRPSTRWTSSERLARSLPRSKVSNYPHGPHGSTQTCRGTHADACMMINCLGMKCQCGVTGWSKRLQASVSWQFGESWLMPTRLELAMRCVVFIKNTMWEVILPYAVDPFPRPTERKQTQRLNSPVDRLEMWSTAILHLTCTQESHQRRRHGCNLHSILQRLRRPLGSLLLSQAHPRFFILFSVETVKGRLTPHPPGFFFNLCF